MQTRAQRDDVLVADIQPVWDANWRVYGADKVWMQMNREGIRVARCTVERLMKRLGLQGARRGKPVRTATPNTSAPCPSDCVQRVFKAERPHQPWVSDFTYVSTRQGRMYVAFVINVFARRIAAWRLSRNMHTDFVHWFNYTRLLKPIGYIPPAEADERYWRKTVSESEETVLT